MVDGWSRQTIGHVLEIATGQVDPKAANMRNQISIGPDNLRTGGGITKSNLRTACELGQISGKYEFDKKAILYSKIRPNLNKVGLPDFAGICSADIYPMWVRNRDTTDREYVYFLLSSERFVADATSRSFRTGIPKINRHDFEKIIVQLPPLHEQRKIAEILRKWDETIEKLETLRVAKERRQRALTHTLVFGQKQLKQFRTIGGLKPHRWFVLPTSWECLPIEDIAKEVSVRNTDAAELEVLSCSKHEGFVRSLDYFKKQVFSSNLSGYKKIWRGDIGFPSNHVEEGSIGLQNLISVGIVSPIYTVFRFDPEKTDREYAFAVLKTGLYRHIFEVSTSASVDRRGSLRWSEFSKIPFPLPSLVEQKAIADVIRTAKTDIDVLNLKLESLIRQKRGLMQKLLTGEWQVAPIT